MGRIKRLKAVTMGKIEAFLASLERPEEVLPQLVREMTDRVAEAGRAQAKALSAVRAERRRLDAASGRVERFGRGAAAALEAGEEETARQAIAAQVEAEQEVTKRGRDVATAESAYKAAAGVREQLRNQLSELELRKDELLGRVRRLRQTQALQQGSTLLDNEVGDILEAVARMETKVDEAEAEVELQSEVAQALGATFQDERVIDLENDEEVARRLGELKKRLSKGKGEGGP